MDPHLHPCLDLDRILKRAGRDGDVFATDHRAPALRINFFIRSVTIHVGAEIQAGPVELLE
ncbi:MAG: hypothetical protein CV089_03385 [Nitrospira sp. WS110]|nr:hypothetical protein [Nitrospira sp. WS110]